MAENHVSTSTITIDATADRVWRVITDPDAAREFLVGTTMSTDWRVGRPISWRGTWQGRDYEDKGIVLEVDPGRRLVYTHFSPLTGEPDVPENYHTLTWTITGERPVVLELSQDNNKSAAAAAHSTQMWDAVVAAVKRIAERDD